MKNIKLIIQFSETLANVLADKKITFWEAISLSSPAMGLFEALKETDILLSEIAMLKTMTEYERKEELGIENEKILSVINLAEGLINAYLAFKKK